MSTLPDHYGVLEVDREADETTVKKAYRKLVLTWHPDKHPANREVAEEQIRRINDAYETLGNPFKRSQYDQQILAIERQRQGYRLDTTAIKPRMSIPKEFMLSPMGHPEKFVRTVGMSIFVQSRNDAKMEFYDFFKEAKFSLWWLPEVNNMCRLRPTTTAGVGQDGGMNFSFALHRTVNVSEVVLNPGTMPENVNVIAVASPVFHDAFRFESAQFPGHYLAYKPPTHLRMVGGVVDNSTAIDFKLVDYAHMFKYINAEEVLMPAVTALGGERNYVSLNQVRADSNVLLYFQNVRKTAIWADDDFESFFASRSGEWDYDRAGSRVRLRTKNEQLANSLSRSRSLAEVAASISGASELDAVGLPIETLEAVMDLLGQPIPPTGDVSLAVNILDAQKKVLVALPAACEKKEASFRRLLELCAKVSVFCGEKPSDGKIVKWRGEALEDLGGLISNEIRRSGTADEISLPVLATLCQLPLSWRKCSDRLAKIAGHVLDGQPLETVVPLLRAVVKALPGAAPLAERLADLAKERFHAAGSPLSIADSLDAMVVGGLQLDSVPQHLERVLQHSPFALVASCVAGLGERGCEVESMKVCAAFIGSSVTQLEELPPAALLRLTVAATKSAVIAERALDAVASAAALTLPGWSMDDASKLLLAVAKAKGGSSGPGVPQLYARASEVLSLKLSDFSSVQLIKVILAITRVAACRPLLEAAAAEAASNRLAELPSSQTMLLTQGLLALGKSHRSLEKVLDFWATSFSDANRIEDLLTDSMGAELVKEERGKKEAKGQLNADQVAKLVQMVASSSYGVPEHPVFWKAVARRFIGQGAGEGVAGDLTPAGKAALDAVFPRGGDGFQFDGRSQMMDAVHGRRDRKRKDKEKEKEKEKDRDAEKSRDRRAAGGFGERSSADASRQQRQKDKEKGRDKERKRSRTSSSSSSRTAKRRREKEKEKAKEKEKEKEREKAKQKDKEKTKDREKEKEKDKTKDNEREKEREKDKEKENEKEGKDRSGKTRDRGRSKSADEEKEKAKAKEKVRSSSSSGDQRKAARRKDEAKDRGRKGRSSSVSSSSSDRRRLKKARAKQPARDKDKQEKATEKSGTDAPVVANEPANGQPSADAKPATDGQKAADEERRRQQRERRKNRVISLD